ncbi:MAG: putative O-methyltransferase [Chlamydiae bacterium]|nr:putative O-methyltransferase [Chlamydiota bacterium]
MVKPSLATPQRNRQVKDYLSVHFCDEPLAVASAKEYSEAAGLKNIHVPECVGRMLSFFARITGAKQVLEIGTLGGYSTLWLASGLVPEGKIVTIESEESHAAIARENFSRAGESERIEVHVGLAIDQLQTLIQRGAGPFDLIFIDADKDNYPAYLEPCLNLSRKGTLILSDNLIPKRGEIGGPDPRDNEAVGIYTFNQMIASHPRLESHLFPTLVGGSGRIDALGVSIVK